MTSTVLRSYQRESRAFSRASAVAVIIVAAAVLVGWQLDLGLLKSGIPGLVPMNPATAVTFLFAGCALYVLDHEHRRKNDLLTIRFCAAVVVLLPLLSLSRFYLRWDVSPDQWLFPASVAIPIGGLPNRMAPVTGVSFILLGVTMFMLALGSTWGRRVALTLAAFTGMIALMVVVDYGYEARSLAVTGGSIPVALNTAIAFLVLAGGLLSARPADGTIGLFVSPRLGGLLARRLLPAAVLIPLLVGWIELQGEDAGWYNGSGGAAIVAITTTLILAALIWFSAVAVDRADGARARAETELRDLNQHLELRVRERTSELERVNHDLNEEVSARRRADEEVRRTADELRGLFEASPLAICSLTPDSKVLSWNHAAEMLFGYQAHEVIGQTLPIVNDALRVEADGLSNQVLAGTPFTDYQTHRVHRDGTTIDVSISTAALYNAAGDACGLVAMYADMRDRKSLEMQLRQSQKMDAIGRLAGGVAHDFNNILTVIQAAAEFLMHDLAADDKRRVDAVEIAAAAQRAARLTRQLLVFSRQQVVEYQVLDPSTVVKPLEPMLRRLLEANIELSLRLEPQLSRIKADPNQLEQVIMNLVVNARDAMPDGGTILIEASNVLLDEEYPRGHLNAGTGPHVVLSVTDSGIGMDAETQTRIFEPFFTTKALGQGTGLGLATVYGIVKQLGGHIWVYSEVGRGTTFKVYFPAPAGYSASTTAAPLAKPAVITKGARILLVEDDAAVRGAVQGLLERNEYVVTAVPSADDALAWVEREGGATDLVLSDMMMPGMTGLELRTSLRDMGAKFPVLLMSGYSVGAIKRLGTPQELAPHIEKPFTADALVSRIEELLCPATSSATSS